MRFTPVLVGPGKFLESLLLQTQKPGPFDPGFLIAQLVERTRLVVVAMRPAGEQSFVEGAQRLRQVADLRLGQGRRDVQARSTRAQIGRASCRERETRPV